GAIILAMVLYRPYAGCVKDGGSGSSPGGALISPPHCGMLAVHRRGIVAQRATKQARVWAKSPHPRFTEPLPAVDDTAASGGAPYGSPRSRSIARMSRSVRWSA